MQNKPINVTCLIRGEQKYIFLYDDSNVSQAIQMAGKWAADQDLAFSWYDAALVSQRIRGRQETKDLEPSRWRA